MIGIWQGLARDDVSDDGSAQGPGSLNPFDFQPGLRQSPSQLVDESLCELNLNVVCQPAAWNLHRRLLPKS
jgi:hypothetical protein